MLFAGSDGEVRRFNFIPGGEVRASLHQAPIHSVRYLPGNSGHFLTGADDGKLRLWGKDLEIWPRWKVALETELEGHAGGIYSVAVSSDGSLWASAGADGAVRMWDARARRVLHTLTGHHGAVGAVAFAPGNGAWISGGCDGTIRVWDVATGQCRHVLRGEFRAVYRIDASAKHPWAVSAGDDGTVCVWDIEQGVLRNVLTGHLGAVRSVRFLPDGVDCVSVGDDGTARIWDAYVGRERVRCDGAPHPLRDVLLTDQGRSILACGVTTEIQWWTIAPPRPSQARVKRPLPY